MCQLMYLALLARIGTSAFTWHTPFGLSVAGVLTCRRNGLPVGALSPVGPTKPISKFCDLSGHGSGAGTCVGAGVGVPAGAGTVMHAPVMVHRHSSPPVNARFFRPRGSTKLRGLFPA